MHDLDHLPVHSNGQFTMNHDVERKPGKNEHEKAPGHNMVTGGFVEFRGDRP